MVISPELSRKIEDELREFVNGPKGQIDLRKIAADQGILPVILDIGGCYAIRPNGEIVSFAWDEPYKLEVERNQLTLNRALLGAVEKYPKLADLLPIRSPDAVECSYCIGTGLVEGLTELGIDPKAIRCYCGGLGWLPANEKAGPL